MQKKKIISNIFLFFSLFFHKKSDIDIEKIDLVKSSFIFEYKYDK